LGLTPDAGGRDCHQQDLELGADRAPIVKLSRQSCARAYCRASSVRARRSPCTRVNRDFRDLLAAFLEALGEPN